MKLLLLPILLLLLLPALAFGADENKFILSCSRTVNSLLYIESVDLTFLIDITNNKGFRVDIDPQSEGVLTTSDSLYKISFPKSEKYWASEEIFYRYTGEWEHEHGTPPFGELGDGNLIYKGNCLQSEVLQKF
jgi:hypothetical protein